MRRAGCHIANRIEVPATKPQQIISKSKRIREERCVSTVSLVPIGLSSSSCTNLSYPTQGKRAILTQRQLISHAFSQSVQQGSLDNLVFKPSKNSVSPGQLHAVVQRQIIVLIKHCSWKTKIEDGFYSNKVCPCVVNNHWNLPKRRMQS